MNMLEEMRKLKEKVWDNKPWDWGFVAVVNQLEANMDTLLKENAELKARLAEAEAKERSHALIAEQLENAIDCMATAEARLKRAERENAALSAAVDEKIHIAPDDLLATMLARAEEAEAEAARLRGALEMVEWVPGLEGRFYCPWCFETDNDGHNSVEGYDCARQAALRPEQSHTHYCQEHADRWECRDANCERGEVSGCPGQPADATPTPAMLDAREACMEAEGK